MFFRGLVCNLMKAIIKHLSKLILIKQNHLNEQNHLLLERTVFRAFSSQTLTFQNILPFLLHRKLFKTDKNALPRYLGFYHDFLVMCKKRLD